MKKYIINGTMVGLTVALMTGCVATDYTEPGNVSKTGADISSGVAFDSSKLTVSAYAAPTTPGVCTGASDYNTSFTVSNGELSIKRQSTASGSGAGSTGLNCAEVQQIAYLTNAKDNTWKSVISGTLNFGASNVGGQAVIFQRAFSADLDKDGRSDTVAYSIALSGAGAVQVTRVVSMTGSLSTAGGTMTQTLAAAALAAAGDHTFSITIETQASTANAGGQVSVSIDGGAAVTGTENPASAFTNSSTANPAPTQITVGGTTAAMWAVLNSSSVPVSAFNVAMRGTDTTVADGIQAAFFPTIKSLKITR